MLVLRVSPRLSCIHYKKAMLSQGASDAAITELCRICPRFWLYLHLNIGAGLSKRRALWNIVRYGRSRLQGYPRSSTSGRFRYLLMETVHAISYYWSIITVVLRWRELLFLNGWAVDGILTQSSLIHPTILHACRYRLGATVPKVVLWLPPQTNLTNAILAVILHIL